MSRSKNNKPKISKRVSVGYVSVGYTSTTNTKTSKDMKTYESRFKTLKEQEQIIENRRLRTWTGPYIDEIIRDCENDNIDGNPKYPDMDKVLIELREFE